MDGRDNPDHDKRGGYHYDIADIMDAVKKANSELG